jgi:hypothetical protein
MKIGREHLKELLVIHLTFHPQLKSNYYTIGRRRKNICYALTARVLTFFDTMVSSKEDKNTISYYSEKSTHNLHGKDGLLCSWKKT